MFDLELFVRSVPGQMQIGEYLVRPKVFGSAQFTCRFWNDGQLFNWNPFIHFPFINWSPHVMGGRRRGGEGPPPVVVSPFVVAQMGLLARRNCNYPSLVVALIPSMRLPFFAVDPFRVAERSC